MTTDDLVRRLGKALATIRDLRALNSHLRDDNNRIHASREEWKQKHADRWKEVQDLRRKILRTQQSRDRWRTLARKRGERRYNYRRNGRAPWHNIHLSEQDLERILAMPVRKR